MDKEMVISKIKEVGLVAVVRAESGDQAKRITEACIEAGIAAIEMTFTVPMAHKVIEEIALSYSADQIILGAGTVLDPETARIAILSGSQYIVSPYLNIDTIKLCNRYRVPCMPGVMTITEAVTAMEAGADIIKLFPGDIAGPQMIKAVRGPLPYAKIMPTGGVDVDNVDKWIKAGAVAVGVGGSLTAGAKTGDYASITRLGKEFIEKIKAARAK